MIDKIKHEYDGHYWKRKLAKEKEIKGWIIKEDGKIYVEGNGKERPSDPKRGKSDLIKTLKRILRK